MERRTLIEDLLLVCNRCGHQCQDGRDLIRHKWKKHAVRPLNAQPAIHRTSLAFAGLGGHRCVTGRDFRVQS